jgi:hypothetical protein
MPALYWNGVVGGSVGGYADWENPLNWWLDAAATLHAGNYPWNDDAPFFLNYDLTPCTTVFNPPYLGTISENYGSGATGNCSIDGGYYGGYVAVNGGIWSGSNWGSDGTINAGTFSGDNFSNNDNNNSGPINGGTFSGSGFYNNGSILGGAFSGSGFYNSTGTILGGTFSGSGFYNNAGTISGGIFIQNALTVTTSGGYTYFAVNGAATYGYQTPSGGSAPAFSLSQLLGIPFPIQL